MRKQVGANIWSIQRNGNCPLYICLPPPYPSAWRTGHHYSNSRVPLLPAAASTQQPAQVQPTGAIDSNKIMKTRFFENSQVYGLVLIYIYIIHHFTSFITHKLWGITDHTEYILHITQQHTMVLSENKFNNKNFKRNSGILLLLLYVLCDIFFWAVKK